VATREWYLTNYLLLKSGQSYINVPTTDSHLYWWPEYNLALGSPKDALPTNISSYAVGNGIYLRHYQNGNVLVNASATAATYTFAANDPRYLVVFSGGGDVDANGNVPAGSVTCTQQTGGTFSIPAWSGEVFTFIPLTVSAALSVTPTTELTSAGYMGGPFSPSSASYTLNNTGGQPLNWTAGNTQSWLTLSKTSGTLLVGGTDTVTASIGSGANSLAAGSYSDTVTFTNTTDSTGNTTRPVSLTVMAPPVVSAGGNQTFTLIENSTSDCTLNGTATGNGITSIQWTKVSATNSGQVSFNNPNSAATTVRFTNMGTYVLQLAATNASGTTTNQCTITVNPIYGDFGGYNVVNAQDLLIFAGVFGTTGTPYWIPEDLGGSGIINSQNLLLLAGVFGTSYTPTPYTGNPFQ
jgi:hypothetical protein